MIEIVCTGKPYEELQGQHIATLPLTVTGKRIASATFQPDSAGIARVSKIKLHASKLHHVAPGEYNSKQALSCLQVVLLCCCQRAEALSCFRASQRIPQVGHGHRLPLAP